MQKFGQRENATSTLWYRLSKRGHRHEKIVSAIKNQLETLITCVFKLHLTKVISFAERLNDLYPYDLRKIHVFFCWWRAVEMQLKLHVAQPNVRLGHFYQRVPWSPTWV